MANVKFVNANSESEAIEKYKRLHVKNSTSNETSASPQCPTNLGKNSGGHLLIVCRDSECIICDGGPMVAKSQRKFKNI
jgi:hypothetical protein